MLELQQLIFLILNKCLKNGAEVCFGGKLQLVLVGINECKTETKIVLNKYLISLVMFVS